MWQISTQTTHIPSQTAHYWGSALDTVDWLPETFPKSFSLAYCPQKLGKSNLFLPILVSNHVHRCSSWATRYKGKSDENFWKCFPPRLKESHLFLYFPLYFLKFFFISNWRIITLQYWAVFCHTSTWVSHRFTNVPSLLKPHPTSSPIPPL